MNNIASYITCGFLISFAISMQESQAKTETEKYLSSVKAKKVSEQILSADFAKECAKKLEMSETETGFVYKNSQGDDVKKDFENCVSGFIKNIDDKSVKNLSEKIQLKTYEPEATKSADTIKDYLQKRLSQGIYNKDPDDNSDKVVSMIKNGLVDHKVFYQLYKEQLGKNSFILTSGYCLENFGSANPEELFIPGNIGSFKKLVKDDKPPKAKDGGDFDFFKVDSPTIQSFVTTYQSEGIGLQALIAKIAAGETEEYQVCNLATKKECDKKFSNQKYRHVRLIDALKDAEFSFAEFKKTDIIKDRFMMCASYIVPKMCSYYKCNNVYNNSSPDSVKKECQELGITLDNKTAHQSTETQNQNGEEVTNLNFNSNSKKGFMACNVQDRLREYKRVIKLVGKIQEDMKKGNPPLMSFSEVQNLLISAADVNVNDLTTIASNDLSKGIDKAMNGEATAEDLQEKCMEDDGSGRFILKQTAAEDSMCQSIIASLNKDEFSNIETAEKTQASLELKKLENLKDQKELAEFLERNNLTEYMQDGELSADDLEKVKVHIAQEYKAKKLAVIESLKEKFRKESELDQSEEQKSKETVDNEAMIASQAIADVKEHKNRVETLIQYSNVVSSYLEFQEGKGKDAKVVGQNTAGLIAEKGSASEDDKYMQYFENEGSGASKNTKIDYIQFLDTVTGNNKSEDNGSQNP